MRKKRDVRYDQNQFNLEESGSEEQAKIQLLQISHEDFMYNPEQLYKEYPPQKISSPINLQKEQRPSRLFDLPSQEAAFMHRSQALWRKRNSQCIKGEEVCVLKNQKSVNLARFLLIQQGQSQGQVQNSKGTQNGKGASMIETPQELTHLFFKPRPPRNIISYLRRKNLSYLKNQQAEQISPNRTPSPVKPISPTRRRPPRLDFLNSSCDLKKLLQPSPQMQQTFYTPSFDFDQHKLRKSFSYELRKTNLGFSKAGKLQRCLRQKS